MSDLLPTLRLIDLSLLLTSWYLEELEDPYLILCYMFSLEIGKMYIIIVIITRQKRKTCNKKKIIGIAVGTCSTGTGSTKISANHPIIVKLIYYIELIYF